MKNYFNSEERTRHIILLAAQETADELSESEALTPEERKKLKTATTLLKKFTSSVCERFGEPYKRKIENTMRANNLKLVGKYAEVCECISHAANEDLEPTVKEMQFMHCVECDKKNFKDCAMYAMCIACDIDGEETGGCPFAV